MRLETPYKKGVFSTKNRAFVEEGAASSCPGFFRKEAVQPIALTRAERRDILRDAVFFGSTPLRTPRASSGCAA